MAFRLARPRASRRHQRRCAGSTGCRSRRHARASAPRCATLRSSGRWWRARWDSCSPRLSATSRTIRSAPAARSAARSRTPIRPRNGARSRRRSTPRWWRSATRGERRHPGAGLFQGPDDHGAGRGRVARRGAAAGAAARRALRLFRVQPPRRRLRHRHGGGDLPAAGDGAIADSRIAIGGAEAAPRRIVEAEYALKGRQPTSDAFTLAAEIAAKKVEPLDDEQHQRRLSPRPGAGAGAPRAGTGARQGGHERQRSATKWIGHAGRAAGGPAAGHRPRPLRRRHQLRAPASHAHRALQPCARPHRLDRRRRGARAARRRRGVDRGRHRRRRRRSIFAKGRSRSSRRTASRCWRPTRCATSASRSPRCSPRTPMSPRTPPISSRWRSRNCRRCSTPAAEPGEFSPGRDTEPDVLRQGYGDVDAVFARGARHRRARPDLGRHSGVPLETRGALGRYDASRDVLELHGAAKVPHRNKELIARMLGRPPSSVYCFESHVGGGFGIRGELYPEDVLVCVAALRLEPAGEMDRGPPRAPDRRQPFAQPASPRARRLHRRRAKSWRIDDVIHHDNGAYVRTHATRVAMMTCGVLPGPYRVPGAYRAVCHFRLTNKTPAATYRAPGRFETTFVRERLVDAIAAPARARSDRGAPAQRGAASTRCRSSGRWRRWARRSTSTAAIITRCSTSCSTTSSGTSSTPICATRRADGEMVGVGLAMFVEKAGLARSTACASRSTPRATSRSSPAARRSARASRP